MKHCYRLSSIIENNVCTYFTGHTLISVLFLSFMIAVLWNIPVMADTTIYHSAKLDTSHVNTSYDVTGDSVPDQIEFIKTGHDYCRKDLIVKINGKKALKLTSVWLYQDISADLLHLSNGKVYMLIIGHGEHEESDLGGLYTYNNGAMVEELKLAKKYNVSTNGTFSFLSVWDWSLRGNCIDITFESVSSSLARILLTATVTYKNGKFRFTSDKYSFLKKPGNHSGYATGTHYYKASRSVEGYTSNKGRKKKMALRKGTAFKLLKYYPAKNSRFLVKLKNGKTCWINDSQNAGTLSNSLRYWA